MPRSFITARSRRRPQLIVPVAFDHVDEAQRVVRLGVGIMLKQPRFTPARAARSLDWLLGSPEVASACSRARAAMDEEDGLQAASDIIERMSDEPTRPSDPSMMLPEVRFDAAKAHAR